jgi:hypothetical protein
MASLINLKSCLVAPIQIDQTCHVTYDCIEFENLNLSQSKSPYNKHSDLHSSRDTTDRNKMKTLIWIDSYKVTTSSYKGQHKSSWIDLLSRN